MIPIRAHSFNFIWSDLARLLKEAPVVDTQEWQGRRGGLEGNMIELQDIVFSFTIPATVQQLQEEVRPNLPWAEDHFQERISGEPLNPPPSNEWWPFNVAGNEGHKKGEIFSHTYPERYWPKLLGVVGIRFPFGDLSDLVRLLDDRPDTRQAYLPVWYPEDLQASHVGERVPCTLGYHMMQRGGRLSIRYYMRSCDFVRHFRDDVYMTARLCQWMCEQVSHDWLPGHLFMTASSLHAFARDRARISEAYNVEMASRMYRAYA